jgi:hypothetical protein
MATAEKTSSRNVNRIIGNVKRSAGAYNAHVQDAIVAIINHADNYGDCTGAARLLEAMPKSNRRTLAIEHFQEYSPIAVRLDAKTKQYRAKLRTEDDGKYNKFNAEAAALNLWHEREKAGDETIFDYDFYLKSVERLLDRMNKDVTSGKAEAADAPRITALRAEMRKTFTSIKDAEPVAAPAVEGEVIVAQAA